MKMLGSVIRGWHRGPGRDSKDSRERGTGDPRKTLRSSTTGVRGIQRREGLNVS